MFLLNSCYFVLCTVHRCPIKKNTNMFKVQSVTLKGVLILTVTHAKKVEKNISLEMIVYKSVEIIMHS